MLQKNYNFFIYQKYYAFVYLDLKKETMIIKKMKNMLNFQ